MDNVAALAGRAQPPAVSSSAASPFLMTSRRSLTMDRLASGSVCIKQNDYYSQCQPGTASTTVPSGPGSTSSTPTGSAPTGLASIPASTLYQISNFGTNPNNVQMYVYKPKNVASKPALIVASHFTLLFRDSTKLTVSYILPRLHWHRAGVLLRLQVRFTC